MIRSFPTKAAALAELNRLGKLVEEMRSDFDYRVRMLGDGRSHAYGPEWTQYQLEQLRRLSESIGFYIRERNDIPTYNRAWPDQEKDEEEDSCE